MSAALTDLEYNVFGAMENYEYLWQVCLKIFNHRVSTGDYRRMYKNVDAGTDIPPCHFFDEIHQAFPEAKVCVDLVIVDNNLNFVSKYKNTI